MSDRPLVPDGEGGLDADLERRLRAAFGEAAVPEAPAAVHAEAARLAAAPDVRVRHRLGRWPAPGWIAVVLALSAIVVGSLFTGGSSPAPTLPSAPSGTAEASLPGASASAGASGVCDVSPGTMHGTWWREIGGPNAFFNWEEGPPRSAGATWKLIIRVDPDAALTDVPVVSAFNLGTGERAVGNFNSRMDPSNIYHLDTPAPDLPGGWYLFEQPLPTAGCWRLAAAVDGNVGGTAVIEVAAAVPSQAPAASAPTPDVEPTPRLVESMAPAADDVLPLAGRDGLPGTLECGGMRFSFDALQSPTGAEDRIGPEFDVLRSSAGSDPDPGGDYGPDPTFQEVARDSNAVLFLYEQPADTIEDFRYLYKRVEQFGIDWRLAGSGDCTPRAVAPPGYGQATWTLDPAFRTPGSDTRTLLILVNQLECSSGRSASGRISPAFVTWDERELVIEVFVQSIPGGGDCQGVSPTPATLRLPVPLGDRTLFDAGTIGLGGSGG
jgi:hypothetical protein